MSFSDYIVYVDESGDHGLENIDLDYPVFVLAFCIFEKGHYHQHCSPALQRFKFKHFGHDMVVLHEREIRQATGPFKILVNRDVREQFMRDLSELVAAARFTVIASAIRKLDLRRQYVRPTSPYDLALGFCLERLQKHLEEQGDNGGTVHVVFESRGRREDAELELAFRRICAGQNYEARPMAFEPVFVPKSANSGGMQLADLIARPIGRHILDPTAPNRAYEVIEQKFRRSRSGMEIRGYGLKIFP